LTGYPSGTIYDLTTSYELGSGLKLGLNAADYSASNEDAGGYSGGALYVQQAVSSVVSLGVRGEYFKRKDVIENSVNIEGAKTTAFTVSANIFAGPLTIIPEVRFDNNSDAVFFDSSNAAAKNASQFSI